MSRFERLLTAKDAVEAIQLTWPGTFKRVEARDIPGAIIVTIHFRDEPICQFEIPVWHILKVREWVKLIRHQLEAKLGLPPEWLQEAMRLYV
jgi:hypothetical protein